MYTVPKLDDYSPAALDRAVADLFAALDAETAALHSESDWKDFRDRWMARKNGLLTQVNDTWLKAAPKEAKREVGQRVNELKARAEAADRGRARRQIHASSAGREARRRAPRHHPSRRAAPHRREASGAARAGRDRRRLQGDGLLGRRRPRGRDRLLQLRVAELSAEPSGARHAGHAVHRRAGAASPRAIACCCARTPRRCRSAPWRSSRRRCASSFPARCTATIRSTPRTRRCFTRSRGWRSIPTSRSAT